MAIKTYKPYTPSRRFMTGLSSEDITAKASVRCLLVKIPEGTITVALTAAINKQEPLNFIESSILSEINSALLARSRRSNTIRIATAVSR